MKHLLICLALIAAAPMLAQECIDCHEDALQMDEFNRSVHTRNEIACTDCHGDFDVTDEGHDTPPVVNCSNCHDESKEVFQHSIHAATKEFEPLKCKDCHGNHYILSEASAGMGRDFRIHMNEMCGGCHVDSERYFFPDEQRKFVKSYYTSVHSVTIKNSGLVFSATCVDCHGSHLVEDSDDPACQDHAKTSWQLIPETCGNCHKGSLLDYLEGAHGTAFQEGNQDAPVCTDCHEEHLILNHYEKASMIYPINIPKTCLKCHSDPEYIEKYNFSALKDTNYGDSFHGAALKLGSTEVATCVSCHGVHKILSEEDPESRVNKENLGNTCAECHGRDNPVDVTTFGKIHAMTAHQQHPISKWVAIIYKLIILGTLGFFGFYIVIDFIRGVRNRKKKRH